MALLLCVAERNTIAGEAVNGWCLKSRHVIVIWGVFLNGGIFGKSGQCSTVFSGLV